LRLDRTSLRPLVLFMIYGLRACAQGPFDTCVSCPAEGNGGTAFGDFALYVRQHLTWFSLPSGVRNLNEFAREEPWLFELITDRAGHPCRITLKRGSDNILTKSMIASMQRWSFSPQVSPQSKVFCFRTSVFLYVRKVNGHAEIVVPGLTDRE
jgi:hypothetical protein